MLNVCYKCGLYRADKLIDPDGPFAICPECGHKHPFLQLPLLIVSGASGAGKSALCQHLLGQQRQVVLLDADILWRPEFNQPENNYSDFLETWLRMCKNINQSGRPVVLFGAGIGVPGNIEPCVERRYFSRVHYLSLVCDDALLAARLRERPGWRESGGQAFIEGQLRFNQWFKTRPANEEPAITLLDTTHASIEQTSKQVLEWIQQNERN
jgi:hypothetical protein